MKNRLIGFILLIVIGGTISECSSADRDADGVITSEGDLDAFETKVGDCFKELPKNEDIDGKINFDTLRAVPCTESHKWQVFYKGYINSTEEYSELSVSNTANKICDSAVESLINSMSLDELNKYEKAQLKIFSPSAKSWGNDDRSVDCLIGNDEENYTGSILD